MSTIKKLLCCLLALTLCLCAFVGCNGNTNDPKDSDTESQDNGNGDTDDSSDTSGTSQTDDPKTLTGLQDTYDFGGTQEFTILSRSETSYEFESEAGMSGTAVEAAIYARNEEVMERCNVEITVTPAPGNWDSREDFMGLVRKDASLSESDYDLVATHSVYLMNLAVEGLGWDFSDLPNLDLTKRWWSEAFYEQCNYNGAQYIAFGDIAYTLYSYMMVMFFNVQMAENYELEDDLYDLALDGDWTYAKLEEYTKKVTTSMDQPFDSREFGFLTNGHSMRAFITGFNMDWAIEGADGKRSISILIDKSIEAAAQPLVEFSTKVDQVYYSTNGVNGTGDQNAIFSSGKALFYSQMLGQATYLKGEMKDEYGVLPFPKLTDQQPTYRSGYCDDMTAVLVPFNCRNEEMSGTVTEMLSEIGWREVTEEYYEETLKYQSFNDPKCVATLELIRTTFSPTFTSVYGNNLATVSACLANLIETNLKNGATGTIANYYTNYSGNWRSLLKDLYEDLDAIAAARAGASAE